MHDISLQPIYQQIINPLIQTLLQGLALAVAGWITFLIQRYAPPFLRGYLETKASNDLNTALANGVVIAMHKVEGAEANIGDLQVKGAIQSMAVQYAVNHAPDAIARFGLSPNELATKALAYVPVASTTTDTTGSVSVAAPVTVASLPPIAGVKAE